MTERTHISDFPNRVVPEGCRCCDTCGTITDAGDYPDWINGSCEECEPEILQHPDNLSRKVIVITNIGPEEAT